MSIVQYFHWDPDNIAFRIGSFEIAWYGILFALVFLFGYLIMTHLFKKEGVPEVVRDKMLLYVVIGTVVGARLGHCLFYDPGYYLSNPLEILDIRGGGLASHGAAIGLILAMWIFARRITKRHIFWGLDRLVIVVALSGLFIRSGNLVNQEIQGLPTHASIGFIFPKLDQAKPFLELKDVKDEGMNIYMQTPAKSGSAAGRYYIERSQDTLNWERVREVVILADRDNPFDIDENGRRFPKAQSPRYPYKIDRQQKMIVFPHYDLIEQRDPVTGRKLWGQKFAFYDTLRFADTLKIPYLATGHPQRIIDQPGSYEELYYRLANKEGESYVTSAYIGRHPAQLYEAFSYLLIFFLLLFIFIKRKYKVPEGELFGLFLVLTFSARFVIEHFKEVQEPWEQGLLLNMGQILSIPFVLIGAAVLVWVYRRKKKLLNPDYEWPKEYFEADKKNAQKKKSGKSSPSANKKKKGNSGSTGNKK